MDSTTALPGSWKLIVLALTKPVRDAQNAELRVPPTRYLEKANVDTSTPVGFNMSRNTRFVIGLGLTALGAMLSSPAQPRAISTALVPASMSSIGTVEERFQAYNVEMLEVTGGRFWKPYKDLEASSSSREKVSGAGATPAGMNPDVYQYRPPIDLTNARLRKLAAALGPTYVRVSGTWANTTYFYDSDGPPPKTPPNGFSGVLTREQWHRVVDFSHAVNARIITSFATSPGTRDAQGIWTGSQAREFLSYTKSVGGDIAAAEFMNEPTAAAMGGAPKGYDAAAYGRDVAVFRPFLKETAPEIVFLGPGSVGEGGALEMSFPTGFIRSEDLLKATGPVFDVFSYHLYAAVSERCASMGPSSQTTSAAALSQEWLSRPDKINRFYEGLRDRFDPRKPLWITETADAACGGNRWASTFLDVFRYLDSHARLAQQGVRVIAHNTLASSDYGLLDENTFSPRPNYWAALLWRKLTGSTVLESGASPTPTLHVYAHCLRDVPGGVALLAINTDRKASQSLDIATKSQRYTLTATTLEDTHVDLNGSELKLGSNDSIPSMTGVPTDSGRITLPPASVTFLAIPEASNASCH
jgi:heparanase 1